MFIRYRRAPFNQCRNNPNRNRDRNRRNMALGYEKLDVYRLSIAYVAWVYEKADSLNGVHRPAREQWLRASQSIPLDIAEGNGKTAGADRRRYFEIARAPRLSARRLRMCWLSARRWIIWEAVRARMSSTVWSRCSAVSAEEAIKFEKVPRSTASISIPRRAKKASA